jgi:hypothetical protein
MPRLLTVLCVLAFVPLETGLAQQVTCSPPKDSHEAQLFAAFSVPVAYSVVEQPNALAPGRLRVGLEGTYLPNIDPEIRTATVCRPGKGPENTDLLSAFPRPRAFLGLPGGLLLEASWIPPIAIHQVKSNLVALSLARSFPLGRAGTALGLRLHGTFGLTQGPFTCDDADLQDPTSECFQGTRSDDHYHPNIFGAEALLGWSLAEGRFRPFVGTGANILHPRFMVNFTNSFGSTDNTRVNVNLTRGVIFGGATWAPSPRFGLSGEIYSAPADAVTGRLMLSYAVLR